MNAKLASFFVHPLPEFTVAHAPVQQSSAPEDASPIYAEIERLKKLKETYGWNVKHWDYASDLFDVWLGHDDR